MPGIKIGKRTYDLYDDPLGVLILFMITVAKPGGDEAAARLFKVFLDTLQQEPFDEAKFLSAKTRCQLIVHPDKIASRLTMLRAISPATPDEELKLMLSRALLSIDMDEESNIGLNDKDLTYKNFLCLLNLNSENLSHAEILPEYVNPRPIIHSPQLSMPSTTRPSEPKETATVATKPIVYGVYGDNAENVSINGTKTDVAMITRMFFEKIPKSKTAKAAMLPGLNADNFTVQFTNLNAQEKTALLELLAENNVKPAPTSRRDFSM